MPLNKQKGNMYGFISHTWNCIKGACPHGCSYCYMKRWKKILPPRLDEKEFKSNLGQGNYIFSGSSYDVFSDETPTEWIIKHLTHLRKFQNAYFHQTKNPKRFYEFEKYFPTFSDFCITLETNRHYPEVMRQSPPPDQRIKDFTGGLPGLKMITIEPIMDFDFMPFFDMINTIKPYQVNIGADSGRNNLPEPKWEKVISLIDKLRERNIKVHTKSNLERLRRRI